MTYYSLNETDPQAVCIDGSPAGVYKSNPANKSNLWVILIGTSSSGVDICIDEPNCAQMAARVWRAAPGVPPPPPPPPVPLSSGPMSQDCAINPDWCGANFAQISLCDYSLGLSDVPGSVIPSGCPTAGTCCAKPPMYFRGRRNIAAAITKLGALGLSKATSVLALGAFFGGTAAILNADFLEAQVMAVAPGVTKFKVLAADPIHVKDPPPNPTADPGGRLGRQLGPAGDWFPAALRTLNRLTNGTATKVLSPACLQAHADDPTQCLYASTALKYTKVPIFLAQEMPGLWETQCRFEGGAYPSRSGPGLEDACSGGGGRTGVSNFRSHPSVSSGPILARCCRHLVCCLPSML